MRFIPFEEVRGVFEGKSVAVVGSGPGCARNLPGNIDSHDVVCRINNYKIGPAQGWRCDVHYSFYGGSIRKTSEELRRDGVTLCMCKCPNSKPLQSAWHEREGKQIGIDFRYIYERRLAWWFCDTFVPDDEHFLRGFNLLGGHIPTTGFAAILDVLASEPASLYLTGFDFFASGVHNVDEPWRYGNPADPIGHVPDAEAQWLRENLSRHPITTDATLHARLHA